MPPPGPALLGRGVVVMGGAQPPAAWSEAPVVVVDEAGLVDPQATVERLHEAWARRQPIVVQLRVDPARFREPASIDVEPWRLAAAAEPWFDRLHFLVWANTYDARGAGEPVWWWAVKAARLGAEAGGPADVVLPDGAPAWIDGGPRQPLAEVDGCAVVHSESIDLGSLATVAPAVAPDAPLAADQLAAVSHLVGPARVIAPAGSGKTRVLTERLRHLHRDRGYERDGVLAVAYNKQAQLEMEARTIDFRPRVRTLNSLGLWVLAEHRGGAPPVVDERDVRRLIDDLMPGRRQRRANTDPIGPYVEGLSAIRLGLTDPDVVEASRDDVPGLAAMFPAYRDRLGRARCGGLRRADLCRRRGPAARRTVPPLDAALVPPRAGRRVPGPHASPRPAAPLARPAGARRVRRRRRRPVHLRLRRRRSGIPHRLRPAVPRRRGAPVDRQLPVPSRGGRRGPHAPRLQPPPGRQGDRGGAGQRSSRGRPADRRPRRRRGGRRDRRRGARRGSRSRA